MRTTLVWMALGALALPAAAEVTKADLKKLAAAGISDDVVLAFVRANQPVGRFNADDLVELKQAGLGDRVLAVLAGEPAPVVERRVVVPQETYYIEPAVEYAYSPLYLSASTYSSYDGYAGGSWFPSLYLGFGSCSPRYYGSSSSSACGPRPYRPVASCPPGSGWSTPPSPGGHSGGRPGHGWTTPPGHGATPPGHGGTPPGQGSGSTRPGHIGNPSHGGTKPPGPGHQGGGPRGGGHGNSGRR